MSNLDEMKKSAIDREKLKDAIDFARENGLKSICIDGVAMEIGEIKEPKHEPRELTEDEIKKLARAAGEPMSEEEILYYSTPYYDELQARKKAKEEAAKETMDLRGDEL